MKPLHNTVKAMVLMAAVVAALPALAEDQPAEKATEKPAAKPDHWVAAMYFHRTVRCPTCKKISQYIEEATKGRFGKQMKQGTVGLYMIDYQSPKNKKYVKSYKITRPTLAIADVRKGKVVQWKAMPKVWSLVFDKQAFEKYVQKGVAGYLEQK